MRVLLDENFPLRLCHLLRDRGVDCDHIILLGLRGISDRSILDRVEAVDDVVLLTQDADFEDMRPRRGQVVISRLAQSLPMQRRVELWLAAVQVLISDRPEAKVLEITYAGDLRELSS